MIKKVMLEKIEETMDCDMDYVWNEICSFNAFRDFMLKRIKRQNKNEIEKLYKKALDYEAKA